MVDEKVDSDELTDEGSDEPKSYDAEYVRKLKAEAKEYRTSKSALRKEFDETKAKLDTLEAAKLTETEKDKKHITELEKQLADINGNIKAAGIDNLILKNSVGKNFVDIDVVSMLAKKELEAEETIDDKAVAMVIDNLIKAKPFLVASGTPANPSSGNFAEQDRQPAKNVDQMMADFLHN